MLILHAHLPYVRHPEHPRFLEENWLYEATTETYIPLLQLMEGWEQLKMNWRLTLSISPTLCAMLQDSLLQERYQRYLDNLIELTEREIHRTHFEPEFNQLAWMYHNRLKSIKATYAAYNGNLVGAFAGFRRLGKLEIITTAATHALLPLLAKYPSSLRAQIMVARDEFCRYFGEKPTGFWLPECAYSPEIEKYLVEAGFKWFVVDTHGLTNGNPPPKYGVFAPIYTPEGLVAFGRDPSSSRQVWSRDCGYPGDPRYRDFYRDIGYDLDYDYIKPYLPGDGLRSFTGIKYYRITGKTAEKLPYNRQSALEAAAEHSRHFLESRIEQVQKLSQAMNRQPVIVAPYDAELFGHWWYEGPDWLNYLFRKIEFDQKTVRLTTPTEYLSEHKLHQVVEPSPSTWGEGGYLKLWVNESNAWMLPHLHVAQSRMEALVRHFYKKTGEVDSTITSSKTTESTDKKQTSEKVDNFAIDIRGVKQLEKLQERALKQAGRELLLAQASDWPFIIATKTSPGYARRRFTDHILRFTRLYEQLTADRVDDQFLSRIEAIDNIFPKINISYWENK